MRSGLRHSGAILSCAILALFCACGGGGSSSPSSTQATNTAPNATAPVVSPVVSQLEEYQTYTFTTTATDPDLGDSVASCTWSFGDGTDPVTVTVSPFTVQHVFLAASTSMKVSVTPTDSHGKAGAAAISTFVVAAAENPFTTAAVTPTAATAYDITLNGSLAVSFTFTVDYAGVGTVPASGVVFDPGSTLATATPVVTSGSLDGVTAWTVTMVYPSPSVLGGTYSVTPTVSLTDSYSVQSASLAFPTLTFKAVTSSVTPAPPSIAITVPSATSTQIYALETASLTFTVTDVVLSPTTVEVSWGDATTNTKYTLSGSDLATGMSPTSLPTHQYLTAGTYTATITAQDTQTTNNTATPQTREFKVLANALPTAAITTPQSSGMLPELTDITSITPTAYSSELKLPFVAQFPEAVVIPMGGQLNFNGTTTVPGSGEEVKVQWSFPGGSPGTSKILNPGSVSFAGESGKIVAYLVELQAIDTFGRSSSQVGQGLTGATAMGATTNTTPFRKWVIVDGINTKNFTLNLLYRKLGDDNTSPVLTPVVNGDNGLGATMMIFQDGQSNTYQVSSANTGTITVPVRGNLPFYLDLPSFNSADPVSYMMRIPNVTGLDPALETGVPAGSSSFAFVDGNPVLSIVTAHGFAPEGDTTGAKVIQGTVYGATEATKDSLFKMGLGDKPDNDRWFDRMSVPRADAISFEEANGTTGSYQGIVANQSFAEWPIFLMSVASDYLPYTPGGDVSSASPTTTAGTSTLLGFNLDHAKYAAATATKSDTYGVVGMQAFRVPGNSLDPYDLTSGTPNWDLDSCVSPLNPQALPIGDKSVPAFLGTAFLGGVAQGGLQNFVVPYNTSDVNRVPGTGSVRSFVNQRRVFSYAEYLWSSVWEHPLVLNSASLDWIDTDSLSLFPYLRTSNPTAWPKYLGTPGILPDNSNFDLTANGAGTFDGLSPVALNGATPDSKAVGRFFWAAFTPTYNSATGAMISRTWLSDSDGLPPKAYTPGTGDALSALGLLPPQDTAVDERGRNALGVLNGAATGGFRVMWFNPTRDSDGNVVPPDFWVIEISSTNASKQARTHFLLPSSYPAPTASGSLLGQATTDSILTDARVYLPSHTAPGGTAPSTDTVAPGYCWFDVPPELRPTSGEAVITVFALKSILNNSPIAAARALNRTDWIDAIKTATANISTAPSSGTDLGYVHKIPFRFGWDIVVVNGEATLVAP